MHGIVQFVSSNPALFSRGGFIFYRLIFSGGVI